MRLNKCACAKIIKGFVCRRMYLCSRVCVCVCERERESEQKRMNECVFEF